VNIDQSWIDLFVVPYTQSFGKTIRPLLLMIDGWGLAWWWHKNNQLSNYLNFAEHFWLFRNSFSLLLFKVNFFFASRIDAEVLLAAFFNLLHLEPRLTPLKSENLCLWRFDCFYGNPYQNFFLFDHIIFMFKRKQRVKFSITVSFRKNLHLRTISTHLVRASPKSFSFFLQTLSTSWNGGCGPDYTIWDNILKKEIIYYCLKPSRKKCHRTKKYTVQLQMSVFKGVIKCVVR